MTSPLGAAPIGDEGLDDEDGFMTKRLSFLMLLGALSEGKRMPNRPTSSSLLSTVPVIPLNEADLSPPRRTEAPR